MSSYVDQVTPGVLAWMESVRQGDQGWGRWKYNAKMVRPWALQASGIAISILHELGRLALVPAAQKEQAVAFLRSCQSPQDGLFRDPLETAEFYTGYHTWEQVWGQRHGAAVQALRLLQAEPLHPLPAAQFVDLRRTDGRRFTLEQIDWSNPWAHGESWARAIQCYLQPLPPAERHDRHPVLAAAFAAFEEHILDAQTGMPSRRMLKPDPSCAMAGLFKTMMAYLAVKRPLPHAGRAIDFTLALQHEDGEFGYRDNMCINWDALWVLRELDRQVHGACRHADIVEAGRRTANRLLSHYRRADGAFAFHGVRCPTVHHSIRLCEDGCYPISDMLGTVMCLRCLAYADEWDGNVPGSTIVACGTGT